MLERRGSLMYGARNLQGLVYCKRYNSLLYTTVFLGGNVPDVELVATNKQVICGYQTDDVLQTGIMHFKHLWKVQESKATATFV